jgi:hypothetical protein
MSEAAVRALLDQIAGDPAPLAEYVFRPELVVRGSTGAAPTGSTGAVATGSTGATPAGSTAAVDPAETVQGGMGASAL